MKIKDYQCKCGHNDFFFADKGSQRGIYCSYCGKWLKWADKDEQNLAMKREPCCNCIEFKRYAKEMGFEIEQESTTKNDLGVDCIDRQAAITFACKNTKEILKDTMPLEVKLSDDYLYENVAKIMRNPKVLPSVTPQEPRWISVSERLPEPNRLVLCHITTGATETYFLALWNDTLNAWEEGIGGYRLLENDLGYEVIEWMPLPKFYKTKSEE